MKRFLAAALLFALISAGSAPAQVTRPGGGGGGVTNNGTGAAGGCTLWASATQLKGDAGCTFTGTGSTFALSASHAYNGDGGVNATSFGFATEPSLGFFRFGAGQLGVSVAGTVALFDTNGLLMFGKRLEAYQSSQNASRIDGVVLENVNSATVGAQKWSPSLRFSGQGWKTDATAGSQAVDWDIHLEPVQGTASPSSNLVFSSQVNGGGYTPRFTLSSTGSGSFADTALSNLASVAVNASLLPGSDTAIDLGSASKRWREIFLGTSQGSFYNINLFSGHALIGDCGSAFPCNPVFHLYDNGVVAGAFALYHDGGTNAVYVAANGARPLIFNQHEVTRALFTEVGTAGRFIHGSSAPTPGSSAAYQDTVSDGDCYGAADLASTGHGAACMLASSVRIATGAPSGTNLAPLDASQINLGATSGTSTDVGFQRTAAATVAVTGTNPTIATTAGNTIAVAPVAPAVAASSQAGVGVTVTASDAVAGNVNAGAAAGGPVTINTGAAKRLTSGNALGGQLAINLGAGIGTTAAGSYGQILIKEAGGTTGTLDTTAHVFVGVTAANRKGLILNAGSNANQDLLQFTDSNGNVNSGFSSNGYMTNPFVTVGGTNAGAYLAANGNLTVRDSSNNVKSILAVATPGNGFAFSSDIPIVWTSSTSVGTRDTGISRVAPKVVGIGNATNADVSGFYQYGGQSRVSSNVTNATTTPAAITGLSATLVASRFYNGRLVLYAADSLAADGFLMDFDGGTATMTAFRSHCTLYDTALLLSTQTTAIATDYSVATMTGDAMIECYFSLTVNAAGTFIPRLAQNAHTTGTATVYAGSHMVLMDTP
jgi:hypothetical protein